MKLLFIFMDGVGLGQDDPDINPFVRASLPNLDQLLDGHKIIARGQGNDDSHLPIALHTDRASLLALDACLGIEGAPQSATGQASLLTGKNIPTILGSHDGPKPSPQIMQLLKAGTLFSEIRQRGQETSLLNAYPPRYFETLDSGYRLPGVIALSAMYAGMRLQTADDLNNGMAISADLTGQGWRDHLGLHDTPILNPSQVGERLADLSKDNDLTFFEYWLSDVAGHQQDMPSACALLTQFDAVLGSLITRWDGENGLILITSDHGNIEDLSSRRHTRNDVPLLLVSSKQMRERFIEALVDSQGPREKPDLTDIYPAILKWL